MVGLDHKPVFTSVITVSGQACEGEPRTNKKGKEQSAALAALRVISLELIPAAPVTADNDRTQRRDDDPCSALDDLCKWFEPLLGVPRVIAGEVGPPFTACAHVNGIVYRGELKNNEKEAEQDASRKA